MDGKHVTGEVHERVCAACGGTFHGNFCIHCGAKAEEMTFCPVCGLDREEGAAFCHNCGYSYMQEEKQEAPAPVVETPKAEPTTVGQDAYGDAKGGISPTPKFTFARKEGQSNNATSAPQKPKGFTRANRQSVSTPASPEQQAPKASRGTALKNLLCSFLGGFNLVLLILVIARYLGNNPLIALVLMLAQIATIVALFIAFVVSVVTGRYMISESFEKKLRISQAVLLPILVLAGISALLPSQQAAIVLFPLALGGFIFATYIRKKNGR